MVFILPLNKGVSVLIAESAMKNFAECEYRIGFEDELTFSEDYSDILAWLNAPAEMGVVQDKDE